MQSRSFNIYLEDFVRQYATLRCIICSILCALHFQMNTSSTFTIDMNYRCDYKANAQMRQKWLNFSRNSFVFHFANTNKSENINYECECNVHDVHFLSLLIFHTPDTHQKLNGTDFTKLKILFEVHSSTH